MAAINHVELWIPSFERGMPRWDWLLGELGFARYQSWPNGASWRASDGSYLVVEESPDLTGTMHVRTMPGLNHLALNAASREVVDRTVAGAERHGWSLMFAELHPFAGGPEHYAAFLVDEDGFEVEVVAPS